MKTRTLNLLTRGISGPMILFALIVGCDGRVNRPPDDQKPPQVEPGTPFNPSPADGATGLGMGIKFSWECENPDIGQMLFAVFMGRDTMEQISFASDRNVFISPWAQQLQAKETLCQIFQMQMAYRVRNNSFCLNGTSASSACPTVFDRIGITIPSTSRYSYTMIAAVNTFTCVASANLDADADWDNLSIDQEGAINSYSQDCGVPYTPGLTYFWQVVVYTSSLDTIIGPVWSFTTSPDSVLTNHPPNAPYDPIPSDGFSFVDPMIIFNWRCDDPEQNFLTFDFYIGVGDTPDLGFEYLIEPMLLSEWRKQQRVQATLNDIAIRQHAYRGIFGSYCANGRGANVEYDYNGFEILGVTLNPEDCFYYQMYSSPDTFTCQAFANIDPDWDLDQWSINQDSVIIHSDDCDVPFLPGTQYSWMIVASDGHGNVVAGPLWHFTTVPDTSSVQ